MTCTAAQGSSPEPTLPESLARPRPAGLARLPFRPRNSLLSPVTVRASSLTSTNATRSLNSVL